MKNYLLIALLFIATIACDKKSNTVEPVNVPINHFQCEIGIKIQDSEGTDLLNLKNAGHYKVSDIDVIDSFDPTNAVSIIKYSENNDFYASIHLNMPTIKIENGKQYQEEIITKVKFGNNEEDLIRGLYDINYYEGTSGDIGSGSGYTVILQKAWFNNSLVYEIQEAENNSNWELPIIVKPLNN